MTNLTQKLETVVNDLTTQIQTLTTAVNNNTNILQDVIGRLDTAQSQGGSTNTLLAEIRNAIGPVSGTPQNYTVKRLLSLIHACICELVGPMDPDDPDYPPDGGGNGGDTPGNGLNDFDPDYCSMLTGGPFRATGFDQVYDGSNDGPGGLDTYIVRFDGIAEVSPFAEVTVTDTTFRTLVASNPLSVCVHWNYTDNYPVSAMQYATTDNMFAIGGTQFSMFTIGGGTFETQPTNSNDDTIYNFIYMLVPAGEPIPNLNVWLKWDIQGS